jgi:hypothetical protein
MKRHLFGTLTLWHVKYVHTAHAHVMHINVMYVHTAHAHVMHIHVMCAHTVLPGTPPPPAVCYDLLVNA